MGKKSAAACAVKNRKQEAMPKENHKKSPEREKFMMEVPGADIKNRILRKGGGRFESPIAQYKNSEQNPTQKKSILQKSSVRGRDRVIQRKRTPT